MLATAYQWRVSDGAGETCSDARGCRHIPPEAPRSVHVYSLRGHVLGRDFDMANSVRPWIAEYLLSVSEEYGAQIYKAPVTQKSRVVQLVQVRAYPSRRINKSIII